MTKKSVVFTLLLAQVFLWKGSAFISVLYKLYDYYSPDSVTLFTEVLYYVMQAAGIALFAHFIKNKPNTAGTKTTAAAAVTLTGLLTVFALISDGALLVMLLGLFMNIGIGSLSGVYLTRLTAQIPQQCRGRAFGYAYAIGSVGTWLLSLLNGGTFLQNRVCVYVFIVLAAMTVFLTRFLEEIETSDNTPQINSVKIDKRLIVLALSIPLACSVVNGLGYYFSAADLSGVLNSAFSRVFYAVGLIVSGIINDKNRRYGAVCCITALIFPFAGMALSDEAGISAFLAIFSYIFYGFFSVYRVVLFADLAGKRNSLLYISVFGLLTGRIGDAIGTFSGMTLKNNQLLLTCAAVAVFIICALLFFSLYYKLYMPRLSGEADAESLLNKYEANYGFTQRQSEIFRLILKGCSNSEIASELFVSESTVKFHVKNILHKTDCINRTTLITKFKKESSR